MGIPSRRKKTIARPVFLFTKPLLEFYRYRQNRSSIRRGCYYSHGPMGAGDAMNLFPITFLIKSHYSQDGRQYHSGAMNPRQGFVQSDRSAGFGPLDFGRSNRIIGAQEIQVPGYRTKGKMSKTVC